MKQSQYDKIIYFCCDGAWHCQKEFWDNFIRSPHKRRGEIERMKHPDGSPRYKFLDRPCEHGISKSKDFMLVKPVVAPPAPLPEQATTLF